jgi:SAM-dependent methyltransferase
MTDMRVDSSLLRCPINRAPLRRLSDDALISTESTVYRVTADGVPILLSPRSLFDPDDVLQASSQTPQPARSGPLQRFIRFAKWLRPSPTRSKGSRERFTGLADLILACDSAPHRTLIVGGGDTQGTGIDVLAGNPAVGPVETDVYIGSRTAAVCDAHQLPFPDASFDAVVLQAVLEHVVDPVRVVDEVHRVLRPPGLVYAETPFMQQVHLGAYDFTRFTMTGHRRLFRSFDQIEAGVVCGPATAALWSLRYLARSIPRHSQLARGVLDGLVCLLFFWLKYLDDVLIDRPGAADGASGTYFLGRKRATPVSDTQVVDSYSGAMSHGYIQSAPKALRDTLSGE